MKETQGEHVRTVTALCGSVMAMWTATWRKGCQFALQAVAAAVCKVRVPYQTSLPVAWAVCEKHWVATWQGKATFATHSLSLSVVKDAGLVQSSKTPLLHMDFVYCVSVSFLLKNFCMSSTCQVSGAAYWSGLCL